MGTTRRTTVAAPSSSQESDQGFESRQPRSPRKSSRKSSAAAVVRSQRTVIETFNEEGEEESEYNPRAFPYHVKQACWEKADKVKGRDPDRWRRDPLGNIVFRWKKHRRKLSSSAG
ncbi:hypothetical protein SUGI_1072840 [Cryptomeria japonica]|nr:hypothetical protein SUGI_1072840 [Cryptomeria japonica]